MRSRPTSGFAAMAAATFLMHALPNDRARDPSAVVPARRQAGARHRRRARPRRCGRAGVCGSRRPCHALRPNAEEIESAPQRFATRAVRRMAAAGRHRPAGFAEAISAAEPYDIFLNNAGTNRPKPFIDVPPEDFDPVIGLNVRAAFFAAQAVVRRLMPTKVRARSSTCRRRWAMSAHQPLRLLRLEMGDGGFSELWRSNSGRTAFVSTRSRPTFIETPLTTFLADEAFRESVVSKIKLGRIGTVRT